METASEEFVIARAFDAPRALVFKAHTECEGLKHWWGPKGFTMHFCKLDLRPGGVFHYGLRSPKGEDMWGRFVYREIVAPERLVFVVSFSDPQGNVTRHPMAPDWPLEMLNTSTFTEKDGKTTVTIRSVPHNATPAERAAFVAGHRGMQAGYGGTFDQLEQYLASQAGMTIPR
jgi:uncharacterized protein YndB with AHSA1/START domain